MKLIGDKITDTEVSNTIEGAKKYADKAIELALADNGSIEKAIERLRAKRHRKDDNI